LVDDPVIAADEALDAGAAVGPNGALRQPVWPRMPAAAPPGELRVGDKGGGRGAFGRARDEGPVGAGVVVVHDDAGP
jgi:hypothetical protein